MSVGTQLKGTKDQKPTLYKIIPFDANNGTTVSLAWTGRQQKGNRLQIKTIGFDTKTIYNYYQASFRGMHTIPPASSIESTLVNGQSYQARVAILDMDGVESQYSTWETFQCMTTPVFAFEGLFPNINNRCMGSCLSVKVHYEQEQGELLYSWSVELYGQDKETILEKEEDIPVSTLSHNFYGLQEGSYYVRGKGVTINGIEVETGFYSIVVKYKNPAIFLNLEAVNMPYEGSVVITSNAIDIKGHSKYQVKYLDDDREKDDQLADLVCNDNIVWFDEGFEIKGDFVLYIKGYNFALPVGKSDSVRRYIPSIVPGKAFLKLNTDTNEYVEFNYWKTHVIDGTTERDEYQIFMHMMGLKYDYGLWSNYITNPQEGDRLGIRVIRHNGIYNLELTNYDQLKREGNEDVYW